MNKTIKIIISFFLLINTSFANYSKRLDQIKNYATALQNHDAIKITSLFANNGYVVSTSQGKIDAREFFNNFLPFVLEGKVDVKNYYGEISNSNALAASFELTLKLINGEVVHGFFVDEFLFQKNSDLLEGVIMYENTKYPQQNAL